MSNHENNPLIAAQAQVKKACEQLKLPEAVYELLKNPKKVLEVSIPVKMDDGSLKVFTGYRSQHNDAIGPFKGGIRFWPTVTREEVMALSIWMTFKCSVTGIPYGGGKGGVNVDTSKLSQGELERLSRGYIQAVYKLLGEKVDVPASDMGTNAKVMAWMTDEYCKLTGQNNNGILTSKPVEFGGSKGREAATGLGVTFAMRETCKKLDISMNGAKIALQGFGNVGSFTAKHCYELGAKIIAIAELGCTLYDENGLDIPALMEYKAQHKTIKGFAKEIDIAEFWSLEADALIPAALENEVTPAIAENVRVKMVIEAANGPVTPDADEILRSKGIIVIPDILANAGGVTVSYFEWVQNLYGYYWDEKEVHEKEERAMVDAFNAVYAVKEEYDVSMREAAYMYSIKRIAEAMKLRGWY